MIKLTLSPSPICRHQLSPRASLWFFTLFFSCCFVWLDIVFSGRYFGNKQGVKGERKSWGNRGRKLDFIFLSVILSFFKGNILYIKLCHVSCFRIWQIWHSYVYRMKQTRGNRTLELDSWLGACGSGGTPAARVGNELAWPAEQVSESFGNKLGGNTSKELALERAFNEKPGESLVKWDNGKSECSLEVHMTGCGNLLAGRGSAPAAGLRRKGRTQTLSEKRVLNGPYPKGCYFSGTW